MSEKFMHIHFKWLHEFQNYLCCWMTHFKTRVIGHVFTFKSLLLQWNFLHSEDGGETCSPRPPLESAFDSTKVDIQLGFFSFYVFYQWAQANDHLFWCPHIKPTEMFSTFFTFNSLYLWYYIQLDGIILVFFIKKNTCEYNIIKL